MENNFFVLDNKKIYFLCGEVHYFRVPKALWYDRLLKIKRAGLNCIASYIAWNWHEPVENLIIFDDKNPGSPYESNAFSRDLENYIKLIKELGLYFIARPGPYICSEWDSGGHPNWLYTKGAILRSLDENYIRYTEKWYDTVLPIIAKYTVEKGGPITLLQIENEYFWGDVPYHLKLYEIARNYVKDIPIITNENYLLSDEDPIINTIDDYPTPWDIKPFDSKVKRYLSTQKTKPKMFMELEGGWFSTFGSPLPTNRGSFPPEWTETLLKTALGFGINGISIYMFHGGTNPGYYTGKYITTTYDYEAAIREWGELSPRYYTIKRFSYFIKTFHEFITNTKPVEDFIKCLGEDVDILTRVDDKGRIAVILRNTDQKVKHVKLMYEGGVHPYVNPIMVQPRSTKIVLLNYTIDATPFKIIHTSSEPLIIMKHGKDVIVIFYGDVYEVGEIAIESSSDIEIEYVEGILVEKMTDRRLALTYTISDEDKVLALKSGVNRLYIVIVSRERAERTWYIDDVEPHIVLISNLYFIGKVRKNGSTIELELEADDKSYGNVVLVSFEPIDGVKINGRETALRKVIGPIYRFYGHIYDAGDTSIEINIDRVWRTSEDPLALEMIEIDPRKPLEFVGNMFNGYSVYNIEFKIGKDMLNMLKNKVMFVSSFNDYATVILNGRPIASDYHSIEAEVSHAIKEDLNRLMIIVESTGHTNDGLVYIPNGVVGDIYLGKVDELVLTEWKYVELKPPYGRDFSLAMYMHRPKDIEEKIRDPKIIGSAYIVQTPSKPGIYIKEITVDKSIGRYILDLGKVRANYYQGLLVFVNKRFVGLYKGPMDITEHLNDGINEVVLAIAQGPVYPRLKIYQHVINGVWKVRLGTEGLLQKFFDKDYDDSNWKRLIIPSSLRGMMGKVIWIRGTVNIKLGKDVIAPLKLIIRGSGIRALIYFNGQFIGRYADEGPQTEFYIPEPIVKNGENRIAIMLHIINNNAAINYINIEPYYMHIRSSMEIKYQAQGIQ